MTAKNYVEVYILPTAHKLRRGDPARIAAAHVLKQRVHKARFKRLRAKVEED